MDARKCKPEEMKSQNSTRTAEVKPDLLHIRMDREGYIMYEAFLKKEREQIALRSLILNGELGNNSFIELKEMTKKYAEGCLSDGEKKIVAEALRQHGYNSPYKCFMCGMSMEEFENFMNFAYTPERRQYIEQITKEMEQMSKEYRPEKDADAIRERMKLFSLYWS